MRVEADRSLRQGFDLDEKSLRRIAQTVRQSIEKVGEAIDGTVRVEAKLADGSLVEATDVADVLDLDNGGRSRVRRITLTAGGDDNLIEVAFARPSGDDDATPVALRVTSNSRDWAFVTAAEIEEQLRRIKRIGWQTLRQWALPIAFVLGLVGMLLAASFIDNFESRLLAFEAMYEEGKFRDPIHAMIELERGRKNVSPLMMPLFAVGGFGVPLALFSVLPWLHPSCCFRWGDQVAILDRRRRIATYVWGSVIGGLVVSLTGSLLWEWLS